MMNAIRRGRTGIILIVVQIILILLQLAPLLSGYSTGDKTKVHPSHKMRRQRFEKANPYSKAIYRWVAYTFKISSDYII